jgi:hypothetical protein
MPGAADEQATVLTHEADSAMDQSRINPQPSRSAVSQFNWPIRTYSPTIIVAQTLTPAALESRSDPQLIELSLCAGGD